MPDGMEKIEHLVIFMMENRSFDHYLGSLSLVEGRTDVEGLQAGMTLPDQNGAPVPIRNLDGNGNTVPLAVADGIYCNYLDPDHGWVPQHHNYDNGLNDGFVKQYQQTMANNPDAVQKFPNTQIDIPVGYYTRATLPVLYALADRFTLCDHWFSSLLSSTWPNRKYLHSGVRDDDNDTQTLPPFPGFETTPLYNVLEDTRDPVSGNNWTWKSYFSDLPFLAFWYKFAAFHAFRNFTSIDNFVHDCREDALPTVSIIDPAFSLADDHPSHDVRLGQKFIGLIVDALTHSESWAKTALVLLYDENGGFYDHVEPPTAFEVEAGQPPFTDKNGFTDDQLGFRVPALVISPYPVRQRDGQATNVCKTVFDHTSILKSIQMRWGGSFNTPNFGTRWQYAPDIWSTCFDFDQDPLPMGTYTQPAADVANNVPSPMQGINWGMGIHDLLTSPIGSLEALLERIFLLPGLKALDQRAQVFDNLS